MIVIVDRLSSETGAECWSKSFVFDPAKSVLRRTRNIYWETKAEATGIWTLSLDRFQPVA